MPEQDDDWDKLLNPFRYHEDGSKTEAAKRQDAAVSTQLNSTTTAHRSGHGTTSVDTAALARHAAAVDQINGTFSSLDYLAKSLTATAAVGFADWQITQGLSALTTRWNDQKTALERTLSAIGEKLRQSAKNYTATDETQAQSFTGRHGG